MRYADELGEGFYDVMHTMEQIVRMSKNPPATKLEV